MKRAARLAATLALGLVAAADPLAAQGDPLDGLALEVTVPHAPRAVYRAVLLSLAGGGYRFRALGLDRVIMTQPMPASDSSFAIAYVVEVEPRGDSTHVVMRSAVLRPRGKPACSGDACGPGQTAALVGLGMVGVALDSITPHAPGEPERLAASGAYGYSAEHPIRTGGIENRENGAALQHAYLDALRGPDGQAVRYYRMGSCCEFASPNGHEGKGYLDAYEVSYPGQSSPAVLYLDLYSRDAQLPAPAGFKLATGTRNP